MKFYLTQKKKEIYDRFGEEGLKQQNNEGFDPSNMFQNFFRGSGFNFNFGDDMQQESDEDFKGDDLEIPIHVSLEDIYNGKIFEFKRVRTSHEDGATPRECRCRQGNTIRMTIVNGVMQRTVDNNCEECQNRFTVVEKTSVITVDIEPGIQDGAKINYYGEADATTAKRAGDLIFVIVTAPHENFIRSKQDLKTKMTISLKEALIGFTRTIKHLDGRNVEIKSEEVIVPQFIKKNSRRRITKS